MMQKHIKSNHLLRNKWIVIVILVLFISIIIYNHFNAYKNGMKRKLIGCWNIELENSYVERDSVYQFSGIIMNIKTDSLFLPEIFEPFEVDFHGKTLLDEDFDFFDKEENIEKYQKYRDRMAKKSKGTWSIINTTPDSVFFNVPNHPLHGKYAIYFFIDKNGYVGMNNIYKMELKNDSTYLICNKGLFIREWERRNWESK